MSTKVNQIVNLSKQGKSPKEIAKITGTTLQYVYDIRSKQNLVSKNKKNVSHKQKSKEVYRWVQVDKVDPQATIESLKHEIVGYKAVISYLEHRLGLSSTQ